MVSYIVRTPLRLTPKSGSELLEAVEKVAASCDGTPSTLGKCPANKTLSAVNPPRARPRQRCGKMDK